MVEKIKKGNHVTYIHMYIHLIYARVIISILRYFMCVCVGVGVRARICVHVQEN